MQQVHTTPVQRRGQGLAVRQRAQVRLKRFEVLRPLAVVSDSQKPCTAMLPATRTASPP
jgi:hypothetical protein